jgi:hypothetical protein
MTAITFHAHYSSRIQVISIMEPINGHDTDALVHLSLWTCHLLVCGKIETYQSSLVLQISFSVSYYVFFTEIPRKLCVLRALHIVHYNVPSIYVIIYLPIYY